MRRRDLETLGFDEALSDVLAGRENPIEVPLHRRVVVLFGLLVVVMGFVVIGRVVSIASGFDAYRERAYENSVSYHEIPAPRAVIYDRFGEVLAENEASFFLYLDTSQFFRDPTRRKEALLILEETLGISPDEVWARVGDVDFERSGGRMLVADNVSQSQAIALKGAESPLLTLNEGFRRVYPRGNPFSALLGYTGIVTREDFLRDPTLSHESIVGRSGAEGYYDSLLRGTPGYVSQLRNAQGEILEDPETRAPLRGEPLVLTLDAEFQEYFYSRFTQGLRELGRTSGAGLAMDPRTGEILALLSFPSYDNNVFVAPERSGERVPLLEAKDKPLFNRVTSGLYNPGSTIKPLHGVAALAEGVVTPKDEIFSPGYLDVPNPYRPDEFTRFLDWRYQGSVNLAAAIAQSSNVYFYAVGGGTEDRKGLGITKLHEWWEAFGLGVPTGVDFLGEARGFLPEPEEKEARTGTSWLLGDTYNVSIGQGDLLLTPLQILSYVSTIANSGKLLTPYIAKDVRAPNLREDLSALEPFLREVRAGMERAVTDPLGTAHLLNGLPVAAKTGSAQVFNNTQENAFFVGYEPKADPRIAILILIENSKQGSSNTLPIARDVLRWYIENRL